MPTLTLRLLTGTARAYRGISVLLLLIGLAVAACAGGEYLTRGAFTAQGRHWHALFGQGFSWLLLALVVAAAFMLLPLLDVELHTTDGHVLLTDESISRNGEQLPLAAIQRIESVFVSYRGQAKGQSGARDGSGNTLTVYLTARPEPIRYKVLVDSKAQRDELIVLLKTWKTAGVQVLSDGLDLV